MSITKCLALALSLSFSTYGISHANSCENRSGISRAELIELYTSEGCSSCPPADNWLNTLVPGVLQAEEVVPLAFHVDYWDRMGWRDRYAEPAYTARQYANAKVSGSGFVFTPQVILAGRNFSEWMSNSRVKKAVLSTRVVVPDATIVLRQQPVASGKLEFVVLAQLRPGYSSREVHIYAALFENGLVSDVGKGENSGRQLKHDYVVRSLLTSNAIDPSGKINFKGHFVLPEGAQVKVMGVAVFAQDVKTGAVLQAMSGKLCTKNQ